jgi:hypothetical protein
VYFAVFFASSGVITALPHGQQRRCPARRCQAFILHYCCSCLANSVSLLRSRSAAYAEYNRLMIEGSRCKRRPISLTLALPHSRARYTNIDLAPSPIFVAGVAGGVYAEPHGNRVSGRELSVQPDDHARRFHTRKLNPAKPASKRKLWIPYL